MNFKSRTCEFEQAYVIVVIFDINNGLMMLDDHLKLVRGD